MTNFEKTKAMTVEEMAKIFGTLFCQTSLSLIAMEVYQRTDRFSERSEQE